MSKSRDFNIEIFYTILFFAYTSIVYKKIGQSIVIWSIMLKINTNMVMSMIKKKQLCFYVIFLLSFMKSLSPISMVYNFRIAQITRQPIVNLENNSSNTVGTVLFDFFQKSYTGNIFENYSGGFINFNHTFSGPYYFRTDFAVSHITQTINDVKTVDEIEPDDILCTFGKTFLLHANSHVTLSGLIGIPTHSVFFLQRIVFGGGQVGIGVQIDGLQKLTQKTDFLWGARYNYFLPRAAQDALHNSYKFTVGSIADLLLGLQTSMSFAHGIEVGYSGRWGFGAYAVPTIPLLSQINYMRNNIYAVYKYTFLTNKTAQRATLSLSYGRDSKPKDLGYQYAFMIWGGWGMKF